MNGRISFHEAAEREIIDAVSFFQAEEPELGGAFIDGSRRPFFKSAYTLSPVSS